MEPTVKRVLIEAFCSLPLRTEEEFAKLLLSKWPKQNQIIRDKLAHAYLGEKDLTLYNPIKVDLEKLLSLDDRSLRFELNALLSKDLTFLGVYPSVFDSKSKKVFVDRMWSLISEGKETSDIRTSLGQQIKETDPSCSASDIKKISSKAIVTDQDGMNVFHIALQNEDCDLDLVQLLVRKYVVFYGFIVSFARVISLEHQHTQSPTHSNTNAGTRENMTSTRS